MVPIELKGWVKEAGHAPREISEPFYVDPRGLELHQWLPKAGQGCELIMVDSLDPGQHPVAVFQELNGPWNDDLRRLMRSLMFYPNRTDETATRLSAMPTPSVAQNFGDWRVVRWDIVKGLNFARDEIVLEQLYWENVFTSLQVVSVYGWPPYDGP